MIRSTRQLKMSIEVKGVKYKGEFGDVQYDNPAFDSKDPEGLHQRQTKENGRHDTEPTKEDVCQF